MKINFSHKKYSKILNSNIDIDSNPGFLLRKLHLLHLFLKRKIKKVRNCTEGAIAMSVTSMYDFLSLKKTTLHIKLLLFHRSA